MKHKIFISRGKSGLGSPFSGRMIKRAAFAALESEGIKMPCEISVLLTDDEGIRKLNREFRDMDKPTDVLSFPANEMTAGVFQPAYLEINPKTRRIVLGDMAISLERAKKQAAEYGHSTRREIQYLTVHSVLHLLGYDHVDEGEMKQRMRDREKAIMLQIEGAAEK